MPKIGYLIAIAIIVLIILKVFFRPHQLKEVKINIKSQEFKLEIAKTVSELSRGLGGRTKLCNNCGMLFIFPADSPMVFWMKDTLIPLDMIFLDKNGKVLNIITAETEIGTPDYRLKLHKSQGFGRYVIELNKGAAQKINLNPGDVIDLSNINEKN